MADTQSCGSCHFWTGGPALETDSGAMAMCKRHAPSPAVIVINETDEEIEQPQAIWPWTSNTDCCGDWQKRKGPGIGA
jgi:hypothetical protein